MYQRILEQTDGTKEQGSNNVPFSFHTHVQVIPASLNEFHHLPYR